MNSPSIPPKSTRGATGAEVLGIAALVVLALGFLGFTEFKNVLIGPKSGGYVDISAIVGEWQAAGRPSRIVFRTDKTIGMPRKQVTWNQVRFGCGARKMS